MGTFGFYPTNFFWTKLLTNWFPKTFVGQNTNIIIFTPQISLARSYSYITEYYTEGSLKVFPYNFDVAEISQLVFS